MATPFLLVVKAALIAIAKKEAVRTAAVWTAEAAVKGGVHYTSSRVTAHFIEKLFPKPASQSSPKKGEASSKLGSSIKQKIEELAYRKWEQDGRPEGRSADYWLSAEQELKLEGAI